MADLVPYGLTVQQLSHHKSWATRRLKYGDQGLSPAGLRRQQQAARCRRKPTCGHGHRWTVENTYLKRVWRAERGGWVTERGCVACERIRYGAKQRDRLARQRMMSAHPDHGGSTRQFLKARQAYLTAKVA